MEPPSSLRLIREAYFRSRAIVPCTVGPWSRTTTPGTTVPWSWVDGPLPVMVFIHDGGLVSGTANDPLFDGARFAQAGLIVVTVNYRLGVFGFLAHPGLTGRMPAWPTPLRGTATTR